SGRQTLLTVDVSPVMDATCTVVIATADVLPAAEQRASSFGGEIIGFNEAQAIQALETVFKRKPGVVAFERMFAITPRGAALINRIKADPRLAKTEVHVVSHDSDYSRVSPRQKSAAQDRKSTRLNSSHVAISYA